MTNLHLKNSLRATTVRVSSHHHAAFSRLDGNEQLATFTGKNENQNLRDYFSHCWSASIDNISAWPPHKTWLPATCHTATHGKRGIILEGAIFLSFSLFFLILPSSSPSGKSDFCSQHSSERLIMASNLSGFKHMFSPAVLPLMSF